MYYLIELSQSSCLHFVFIFWYFEYLCKGKSLETLELNVYVTKIFPRFWCLLFPFNTIQSEVIFNLTINFLKIFLLLYTDLNHFYKRFVYIRFFDTTFIYFCLIYSIITPLLFLSLVIKFVCEVTFFRYLSFILYFYSIWRDQ